MRLFGFSWSFMRLYEDPWDSIMWEVYSGVY
jgi:hypothetical protein